MSLVKIKDFNALIDYKPFLDQSVKNNQEVNKKLIEMSRNNDYCIQQEIYQIICIIRKIINSFVSRQANMIISRKINFTGKLEKDDGVTMLFVSQKLCLGSLTVTE